jgi:hypothetical protein
MDAVTEAVSEARVLADRQWVHHVQILVNALLKWNSRFTGLGRFNPVLSHSHRVVIRLLWTKKSTQIEAGYSEPTQRPRHLAQSIIIKLLRIQLPRQISTPFSCTTVILQPSSSFFSII